LERIPLHHDTHVSTIYVCLYGNLSSFDGILDSILGFSIHQNTNLVWSYYEQEFDSAPEFSLFLHFLQKYWYCSKFAANCFVTSWDEYRELLRSSRKITWSCKCHSVRFPDFWLVFDIFSWIYCIRYESAWLSCLLSLELNAFTFAFTLLCTVNSIRILWFSFDRCWLNVKSVRGSHQ